MGVLRARVGGSWVDIGVAGPLPMYGLESAKPATPTQPGYQYFATDTKRLWLWDGTGWIIMQEPPIGTHVPTVAQGATNNIAKTMSYSQHYRRGGWAHWAFRIALTGPGTAGAAVSVTLPFTAQAAGTVAGMGFVYSGALDTVAVSVNVGICDFACDRGGGSGWGNVPSIALASGNILSGSIDYLMASPYS